MTSRIRTATEHNAQILHYFKAFFQFNSTATDKEKPMWVDQTVSLRDNFHHQINVNMFY